MGNQEQTEAIVMPERTEENVILASNRRVKIRQAIANGTAWFLEAGSLLCEAVKFGDYYLLGYENQKDYFVSEFNISLSTAHNLMDIWELFKGLPTKKVAEAGYTRLTKLLPIVRDMDRQQKEEWIEKAITLPHNAFIDEIKEFSGKIPSDTCEHDYETLMVCKKCGHRYWPNRK